MKAYIGNKTLCLAQPEEREEVEGYAVIYSDGSETFLTKQIFEFEFRVLEDDEVDLVIDSVNADLTHEDIKTLVDMTEEDWEETFDITAEEIDINDLNKEEDKEYALAKVEEIKDGDEYTEARSGYVMKEYNIEEK